MIKITEHSDYQKDLLPFEAAIPEAEKERLMDKAAAAKYGDGGFWLMPLRDLFAIYDGDNKCLLDEKRRKRGQSAFEVYRLKGCAVWLDRLTNMLEGLTLQPSAEEMKWNAGTTKTTFENAIRVFCRDWFGLKNYADVDSLTVTDLLIAKEASYNRAIIDRNMAASMKKGAKK